MRMGFSTADLRSMSLSRLVFMAEAYASANKQDNPNQPREATQADIAAVFC
jgi:hypothetical protein